MTVCQASSKCIFSLCFINFRILLLNAFFGNKHFFFRSLKNCFTIYQNQYIDMLLLCICAWIINQCYFKLLLTSFTLEEYYQARMPAKLKEDSKKAVAASTRLGLSNCCGRACSAAYMHKKLEKSAITMRNSRCCIIT